MISPSIEVVLTPIFYRVRIVLHPILESSSANTWGHKVQCQLGVKQRGMKGNSSLPFEILHLYLVYQIGNINPQAFLLRWLLLRPPSSWSSQCTSSKLKGQRSEVKLLTSQHPTDGSFLVVT